MKSCTRPKRERYDQIFNQFSRFAGGSQIIRFLCVGTFNTASSYLIYAVLIWVQVHYAIANLLALAFGVLLSFRTQGALVFKNSDASRFRRFVSTWIVLYVVNVLLIRALRDLGLDSYQAGAVALFPITALSFFAQKYYVFRPK